MNKWMLSGLLTLVASQPVYADDSQAGRPIGSVKTLEPTKGLQHPSTSHAPPSGSTSREPPRAASMPHPSTITPLAPPTPIAPITPLTPPTAFTPPTLPTPAPPQHADRAAGAAPSTFSNPANGSRTRPAVGAARTPRVATTNKPPMSKPLTESYNPYPALQNTSLAGPGQSGSKAPGHAMALVRLENREGQAYYWIDQYWDQGQVFVPVSEAEFQRLSGTTLPSLEAGQLTQVPLAVELHKQLMESFTKSVFRPEPGVKIAQAKDGSFSIQAPTAPSITLASKAKLRGSKQGKRK